MTRFKNSDLMVSVLPEAYSAAGACVDSSDCKTKPCTNSVKIGEFVTDDALSALHEQLDQVLRI